MPDDAFATPAVPEELLAQLAAAAGRSAADEVEIVLRGRTTEYTRFAGADVHQPQHNTETRFTVRAIVNGHAAVAATGTPAGLDAALDRAGMLAKERSGGQRDAGRATVARPTALPELDLWHQDTAAFDAATRAPLAQAALASARSAGGDAAGVLGRAVTQLAVVNSAGLAVHAAATEAIGSLRATVGDGTSHWIDLHRAVTALDIEESVRRTVREAAAGTDRQPIRDGRYTVVLGPQAVGQLLTFLADFGFAGELAAAGVGLVATRPGATVTSRLVTVADDATAAVGLPFPFDHTGTAKRRVPLLSAGVVGSAITGLPRARPLRDDPTGPDPDPDPVTAGLGTATANLVMSPGAGTELDLIADVAHGFYLQRFGDTRLVDAAAGTIAGVTRDGCFRIHHGELGQPVRSTPFILAVLDLLSTVDGVSDRLVSAPLTNVWNGSVSAPALRARGFRFGSAKVPR